MRMLLFALTSNLWDELSDAASLIIAALFVFAGMLLGYVMRWLVGRWQADALEKKAMLKLENAEAEAEARKKEADVEARAAVVKAREEFEISVAARRAEQEHTDARLTAREATIDRKTVTLDEREAAIREKTEAVDALRRKAAEMNREADKRLQDLAVMTHQEARKEILKRANGALRADAESMSRRIQEAATEQGENIARRIIVEAIGRCAAAVTCDAAVSSVPVPGSEMKGRIVGRDGRNVRAFEAATGVTVILDDNPDSVVLSAFDPVRREIARRALTTLVNDGRIHPAAIDDAVRAASDEVKKLNAQNAADAAAEAGVAGLSNEILDKMGALGFRTSFSQNVLRHSVEVALIAGTMAAELKLDAEKARRIGFLHDIGKAITSEVKGAHAALGAEFLKANGEDKAVYEAVAAHHGETGTDGGVYGVLCMAADTISSSRPGARRETMGDYVQRLERIESIAKNRPGVVSAMAVQAGRDLRVVVDPEAVPDLEASKMARDICREISETQKFPGMIRVTVIRETRCIEYAK